MVESVTALQTIICYLSDGINKLVSHLPIDKLIERLSELIAYWSTPDIP
jgi:hypothetical protein